MTNKRGGGGKRGPHLKGQAKAASFQWARDWRERHRAEFDAMDRAGAFADSVRTEWPVQA